MPEQRIVSHIAIVLAVKSLVVFENVAGGNERGRRRGTRISRHEQRSTGAAVAKKDDERLPRQQYRGCDRGRSGALGGHAGVGIGGDHQRKIPPRSSDELTRFSGRSPIRACYIRKCYKLLSPNARAFSRSGVR